MLKWYVVLREKVCKQMIVKHNAFKCENIIYDLAAETDILYIMALHASTKVL